jgi:ribonuclease BN (tRNA processing enzyme)
MEVADLDVFVLGAGPAYSDLPGALGSCLLVRSEDSALVLDLGQGTFTPLAGQLDPKTLTAVAISHLHPDHFIDLIPLRHFLCRPEHQPPPRLPVLAPDGLEQRLDAVYDQPGFAHAAFDFVTSQPGTYRFGGLEVEARRVRHAGESCAFRVKRHDLEGPGVVYSGDCGDIEDLRPLVRAGDVLVAEASFGPGPVPEGMPHLDAPSVARLARETGAATLVMIHIRMGADRPATLAAARREFEGPVSIAAPGDRFRV